MAKIIIFLFLFLHFPSVNAFSGGMDELIELLKSGDNLARVEASERLMKLGKGVDGRLLKLLIEERDDVRRSVAWILGEWGDKEYSVYLIPLLDGSHDLSRTAIVALGKIGDTGAVPHIIKRLGAKSRYIRTDAVYALGRIGDKSVLSQFMGLRNDPDWHVREAVAIAFGEVGDLRASEHLKEMALQDPDPLVRIAAEEALESLGVE